MNNFGKTTKKISLGDCLSPGISCFYNNPSSSTRHNPERMTVFVQTKPDASHKMAGRIVYGQPFYFNVRGVTYTVETSGKSLEQVQAEIDKKCSLIHAPTINPHPSQLRVMEEDTPTRLQQLVTAWEASPFFIDDASKLDDAAWYNKTKNPLRNIYQYTGLSHCMEILEDLGDKSLFHSSGKAIRETSSHFKKSLPRKLTSLYFRMEHLVDSDLTASYETMDAYCLRVEKIVNRGFKSE